MKAKVRYYPNYAHFGCFINNDGIIQITEVNKQTDPALFLYEIDTILTYDYRRPFCFKCFDDNCAKCSDTLDNCIVCKEGF